MILYPTIALLSAIAFLFFIWGIFEYFTNAANEEGRRKGVTHITYGIIGLVVMVSAFAILEIAVATFGLDKQLDCADDPSASGCDSAFTLPELDSGLPSNGNPTGPTNGNPDNPSNGNPSGPSNGNPSN